MKSVNVSEQALAWQKWRKKYQNPVNANHYASLLLF